MVSARATLVQVQNILAAQSDEGPDDFARLRYPSSTRRERSSNVSASQESDPDCQEPDIQISGGQSCATERTTPMVLLDFIAGI